MPGAGGIAAIGVGSSLAISLLSGDSGAEDAARAQAAAKQKAIETLQRNLAPFRDVGTAALPGLAEASTAQGLDARLQEIFAGGSFRGLVEERGRAVQGQLAASGQSRSGAGLLAAARVPTDIGLQLEQLTQGRLGQLSNIGLQAAGNLGQGVASLQAGIGRDIGAGILTEQQAKAAQLQQAVQAGTGIAGLFAPQSGAPLSVAPGGGSNFQFQPGGPGPGPIAATSTGSAAQIAASLFGGI